MQNYTNVQIIYFIYNYLFIIQSSSYYYFYIIRINKIKSNLYQINRTKKNPQNIIQQYKTLINLTKDNFQSMNPFQQSKSIIEKQSIAFDELLEKLDEVSVQSDKIIEDIGMKKDEDQHNQNIQPLTQQDKEIDIIDRQKNQSHHAQNIELQQEHKIDADKIVDNQVQEKDEAEHTQSIKLEIQQNINAESELKQQPQQNQQFNSIPQPSSIHQNKDLQSEQKINAQIKQNQQPQQNQQSDLIQQQNLIQLQNQNQTQKKVSSEQNHEVILTSDEHVQSVVQNQNQSQNQNQQLINIQSQVLVSKSNIPGNNIEYSDQIYPEQDQKFYIEQHIPRSALPFSRMQQAFQAGYPHSTLNQYRPQGFNHNAMNYQCQNQYYSQVYYPQPESYNNYQAQYNQNQMDPHEHMPMNIHSQSFNPLNQAQLKYNFVSSFNFFNVNTHPINNSIQQNAQIKNQHCNQEQRIETKQCPQNEANLSSKKSSKKSSKNQNLKLQSHKSLSQQLIDQFNQHQQLMSKLNSNYHQISISSQHQINMNKNQCEQANLTHNQKLYSSSQISPKNGKKLEIQTNLEHLDEIEACEIKQNQRIENQNIDQILSEFQGITQSQLENSFNQQKTNQRMHENKDSQNTNPQINSQVQQNQNNPQSPQKLKNKISSQPLQKIQQVQSELYNADSSPSKQEKKQIKQNQVIQNQHLQRVLKKQNPSSQKVPFIKMISQKIKNKKLSSPQNQSIQQDFQINLSNLSLLQKSNIPSKQKNSPPPKQYKQFSLKQFNQILRLKNINPEQISPDNNDQNKSPQINMIQKLLQKYLNQFQDKYVEKLSHVYQNQIKQLEKRIMKTLSYHGSFIMKNNSHQITEVQGQYVRAIIDQSCIDINLNQNIRQSNVCSAEKQDVSSYHNSVILKSQLKGEQIHFKRTTSEDQFRTNLAQFKNSDIQVNPVEKTIV